jgi:hypothetical protein
MRFSNSNMSSPSLPMVFWSVQPFLAAARICVHTDAAEVCFEMELSETVWPCLCPQKYTRPFKDGDNGGTLVGDKHIPQTRARQPI